MRPVPVQCVLTMALIIGWSTVGYTHDMNSAPPPAAATSGEARSVTLFQNVRIFPGKGSELSGPSHVLVRGNQIEKISTQPIPTDRRGDTVIIDGAGRTLMPGLIDAHTHMMFANLPQMVLMTSDITYSEHGQLLDEETVKFLGEKGIWLSLQPFTGDKDTFTYANPTSTAKYAQMVAGTDQAYKWAKQHKVKVAFGTDALFDANLAARQGAQLSKLTRWYTPAEVLTMATSTNAELLAMSGPRNPYPGKLGVVEGGALADLLLVDGNPLENIRLIENPTKNFLVIMKDGKIYKNHLR